MRFSHVIATVILGCAACLAGCTPGSPESASERAASQDPPPATAPATVTKQGFITARDGVRLRYTVKRPDTVAPVPVMLNYEGYAAGSAEGDNSVAAYEAELLRRGYAVAGVSVRGTGCSEGEFALFDKQIGEDGYDAVEWLAAQPWSDGRVGMIGASFGGITQYYVAGLQPPHLRAIAPASTLGDFYRDVVYQGGILDTTFTSYWIFDQKGAWPRSVSNDPDPECAGIYAQHEVANANQDDFIPTEVINHPYYDDAYLWIERAPSARFAHIEVPAYVFGSWQDEELGGRVFDALGQFPHHERLWMNFGNGNHGREIESPLDRDLMLQFYDRFVRDVDNGFEYRVAHVTLAMECVAVAGIDPTQAYYAQAKVPMNIPTWDITRKSLDALRPTPRAFYLHSGGSLGEGPDAAASVGDAYPYPAPAAEMLEPGIRNMEEAGISAGHATWKTPVPPGGAVAYTSALLDSDLVVAGPGSLDLWMTSTATDTDIQATVTEVRPDGLELYVQRGWLRASHRKLDPDQSTELRPYQTHLRADATPLPAAPTLLRVEIFPFAQVFRKGSRIRLWVDAPTSHTGLWGFQFNATPALNTVLHDAAHPSRLVLGELKGEVAQAPLPACDTLRNQPCRMDPLLK